MRYELRITDKQADVIQVALELYGRIAMGQFREIFDTWLYRFDWEEMKYAEKDQWDKLLTSLKMRLTGLDHPNAYRGIAQTSEYSRIGHDIYQVIRHRRAHDREPEHERKGMFVRFDRPLKIGTEPLATIERTEPCTSTEEHSSER
jgi:hypothetical protein